MDTAWLCGTPFLQREAARRIPAVSLWQGRPLQQSYLVAAADDPAVGLADPAGGLHAVRDPDSNSGKLVTASDLARMGTDAARFFARAVFRCSDRNVARAVASGLAPSEAIGPALRGLGERPEGREAPALLQRDGFAAGEASLYGGIRARMRELARP